jgi:hypothetical protein
MPCANKSGNEKSKFSGHSKTMTSWFVIAEATLIKDILRILKQLSLFFRLKMCTVVTASARVQFAKRKLLALKSHCGKSEKKFLVSFLSDMTYTGFQFLSLAPMRRASSH